MRLTPKPSILRSIPATIWTLGFVSLFMDVSSEMIHSLLPIFMSSVLGASMTAIGVFDGFAESIVLISKIFSGPISDYLRRRKPLALLGYGMAMVSKPLFPLAQSLRMIFFARLIDRLGKGIREAPRDALLSETAPAEIRGASLGLRQTLDTIGAFLGPLLAIGGMIYCANNIHAVLWLATIPAIISFFILALFVKEPKHRSRPTEKFHISFEAMKYIDPVFWRLISIVIILSFAQISSAFLILKSQTIGLPIQFIPLTMIIMNIAYATAAYPAGVLSDKTTRKNVLIGGTLFLISANLLLGYATNILIFDIGIILTGLHLAFIESTLDALISDTTPSELRGTAFGIFNLVRGIAFLGAGTLAGFIWDSFGSFAPFFTGAGLSAVTLILLLIVDITPKKTV